MAKDNIILSPKHGVNPSVILCAWCGESKGIAMLGKLKDDVQAPREVIMDYEPCDKCKAIWDKGVACIEVSTTPCEKNQTPISKDDKGNLVYPTSSMCVLKEEAFNGDFKAGQQLLVDTETYQKMFGDTACEETTEDVKE